MLFSLSGLIGSGVSALSINLDIKKILSSLSCASKKSNLWFSKFTVWLNHFDTTLFCLLAFTVISSNVNLVLLCCISNIFHYVPGSKSFLNILFSPKRSKWLSLVLYYVSDFLNIIKKLRGYLDIQFFIEDSFLIALWLTLLQGLKNSRLIKVFTTALLDLKHYQSWKPMICPFLFEFLKTGRYESISNLLLTNSMI